MNTRALALLDRLIREKPSREIRLTELLRDDPCTASDRGWYMCVPMCFNEALDIKQTERTERGRKSLVWTQGSSFSFKAGDTLYDTPAAYRVWSEALKTISFCVQVKEAVSAGPSEECAGRFSGQVRFSVLTLDQDRTKLVESGHRFRLSQDDFVRLLIAGPEMVLNEAIRKT